VNTSYEVDIVTCEHKMDKISYDGLTCSVVFYYNILYFDDFEL